MNTLVSLFVILILTGSSASPQAPSPSSSGSSSSSSSSSYASSTSSNGSGNLEIDMDAGEAEEGEAEEEEGEAEAEGEGNSEEREDGGQGEASGGVIVNEPGHLATEYGEVEIQREGKNSIWLRVRAVNALWKIDKILGVHVCPKTGDATYRFRYKESYGPPSVLQNVSQKNIRSMTLDEVRKGAVNHVREEKRAIERVKEHPVVFECAYCEATFTALKTLKDHIWGKVYKTGGRNRKRIVRCPSRFIKDGVKDIDRLNCPIKLNEEHPPKAWPWAYVTPQDGSLKESDDFEVPTKIVEQWDEYFN